MTPEQESLRRFVRDSLRGLLLEPDFLEAFAQGLLERGADTGECRCNPRLSGNGGDLPCGGAQ
jgi:hypothetical protein